MKITVVNSVRLLPTAYRSLLDFNHRGDLFSTMPWWQLFEQHIATDHARRRIYAAYDDTTGRPRGVLLTYQMSERTGFSNARALSAMSNYYSGLFEPIVDGAGPDGDDAIRALVEFVANERPRWDAIDFHPLDHDAVSFSTLHRTLRRAGFAVQPYFCFGNWYLEVDGRSHAEYFSSLQSRTRNTVQRRTRRLEREGNAEIRIVTDLADVDAAMDAYERVYNSSWKKPEPYGAFIRDFARSAAEYGWLRLGLAYINGEPAAAQIWFVMDGTAYIFKLAYDERFVDLSIGSILTNTLMKHVIDCDRVRVVDYLSGDDSYKRDWMSHRRERWGLVAFNLSTWRGVASAARHIGGATVKRWINTLRGTPRSSGMNTAESAQAENAERRN